LQAAGNSLVGGRPNSRPLNTTTSVAALGVRSLREEYARAPHRNEIPRNLKLIEERVEKEARTLEPVASEERLQLPRFQHLFEGGELLPPAVFIAALELGTSETLNGRQLPYDADVLILRDNLVTMYKPLVGKIQQVISQKKKDDLPLRMVLNFTRAWTSWEAAWLNNREVHAVEALQPLAKAILSLEPLLLSVEKEKLLPWPRVQHQKVVTLKCLEGFVHAFSELASNTLPSLQRELDHDPRLLLLMDHILCLRGDKSVTSCLAGVSTTPEVSFPDHNSHNGAAAAKELNISGGRDSKSLTLDAYAFKLLGASVGDSVAAGLLTTQPGRPDSGSHMDMLASSKGVVGTSPPPKESEFSRRAAAHAIELLTAFENVKDVLLSLKSTLEYIDAALDRDEAFVSHLQRFERAFRRAKRLFLEPDNLA